MLSTPNKNLSTSITQTLTPVRFLESPAKRITSDSNVATCKTRLETIIKMLQDNYAKWQLSQKRGLSLCNSIESIKSRALDAANKSNPVLAEQQTLYPNELKSYCDKLAIITSIFADIARNAREILKQLRALSKLPGSCNEIFYRTWQIQEFIEFVAKLSTCYEHESAIKNHVMEHLAHCRTKVELIRCTTAWEYPQYVDDWVTLLFTILAEELKLSK